ncbi:MAG TPA: LytTR family DNA-binding domain-containing protein [Bacteroidales bacterium]|nr:LytTR family DNA-binding domain-containing protein [Bacteroidales bacterium]
MEQKLNALIVDDEENARILLTKLLEETFYFNEIRAAASVDEAYIELGQFDPDIIFLDIKMPGRDGFSFIEDLPEDYKKYKIVFVTAFDQYALKAIKNQAFDYLLKPLSRKELKQCLDRFIERKMEDSGNNSSVRMVEVGGKITRIRVNTRSGTLFINPSDILFCKAEGNYTTVMAGKKPYLCSMNLGKLEGLLPKDGFIRVGRSHIINFEYITMLDRKESTIILTRDSETVKVKIPRQHLKDLDIL